MKTNIDEKILLVDDDFMVLEGLRRQLRDQFNIETALGGRQALKMIETNGPYAVIVTDYLMPEMNGIELLSRIKQNHPATVRMMLTGSDDTETAIKAVNEGNIFQFHVKPCSADLMRGSLKSGLEKYRKISLANMQLNKVKKSLAYAGEVQQKLMPTAAPAVDGFDIAGQTVYCDETGGDYYDFIDGSELGHEILRIVVGDVSGHGISSALLMTTARAFLRERSRGQGGPASIACDVNKRIARDTEELGFFMTLFYAEIDCKAKRFRWVRAGHEPAILYDSNIGTFEDLNGHGLPLGVFDETSYEEMVIPVKSGQIIFISTDGIKETGNAKGDMFGKERLKKILSDHAQKSASEIIAAVIHELEHFRYPLEREDDVTMVVIKVL
jgi:serine phosphatase RsbU (regulator of sigma subunit)